MSMQTCGRHIRRGFNRSHAFCGIISTECRPLQALTDWWTESDCLGALQQCRGVKKQANEVLSGAERQFSTCGGCVISTVVFQAWQDTVVGAAWEHHRAQWPPISGQQASAHPRPWPAAGERSGKSSETASFPHTKCAEGDTFCSC